MSDSGREMTRTEMMVRIRELAAERDAAIDARLTAEREAAELRTRWREVMQLLDQVGVPDSATDSVLSRVRWLASQHQQVSAAVADPTDGDAFVLTRSAWHLANGCDTVERAAAEARRELAVVLGGGS